MRLSKNEPNRPSNLSSGGPDALTGAAAPVASNCQRKTMARKGKLANRAISPAIDASPCRISTDASLYQEEHGGIEYGGLPVKYSVLPCAPIVFTCGDGAALRDQGRCAAPHQRGASRQS
jgi:hypothetical protein